MNIYRVSSLYTDITFVWSFFSCIPIRNILGNGNEALSGNVCAKYNLFSAAPQLKLYGVLIGVGGVVSIVVFSVPFEGMD